MTTILIATTLAAGVLISPAELSRSMGDDPATVVLAVGARAADFGDGHVPGARVLSYDRVAVDGPDDLGAELPPLADLVHAFESVGVTDDARVVLYGAPIAVGRAFLALDYLGHPSVRVLNGGFTAWKAEGRPVETGPEHPMVPGRASLTPRPNPAVLATADWISANLDGAAMTLVDVRPDEEFTGADGGMGGVHVAGHIPGAHQLVWTDLASRSGQFLPDEQLRARLEAAGARSTVPVVSYCMVGMRASVVYLVARHLGYTAKLYDGSIVDWGRRHLPVRTGRP